MYVAGKPAGATGFTPETEKIIPQWNDPRKEEHKDEMDEVRRRRLEKFLSDSTSSQNQLTKSDEQNDS